MTALIPQVIREVAAVAPELAKRIEEADRKAEAERIAWEAQRQREREEAERARRTKARHDAKQDLLAAIAGWNQALSIRAYFAAAQNAISELPEEEREVVGGRLEKALALIGDVDPLALLRQWKAPEER